MLVGHAHPEVTAAAQAVVAKGTTFFANNRYGIELAEAIIDAVPCAEQVRFVSTGSEADLYAMRAARAFRKRDKILKFEGGYHGMSDYSLMSLAPKRPGNFPAANPGSRRHTARLRRGDPDAAVQRSGIGPRPRPRAQGRACRRDRRALQRIIPPALGFLEGLRRVTAENGVL